MKFILPRLLGLALIAGIASFLLAVIFKLLIGAVIIGSIVYAAKHFFGRRHKQIVNAQHSMSYFPDHFGYTSQQPYTTFDRQSMSINNNQTSRGIIPIN